ncbi:MAG: sulfite reductase subunit A [Planctomycetes bacterium]|nr:sulfite reductase subunit A [Planctomycetota bacterium]
MNIAILENDHLQTLIDVLRKRGYQVIGPTLGEGAIVYDDLNSTANLPIGWTDEQDGGIYRLKKRNDKALFGYNVGPHSWKKYLLPSELRLWKIKRNGGSFQIVTENEAARKFAFVGVRSCDIHAILIQDKVFMNGQYIDQHYTSQRKDTFIVAVNCGKAGGTCFCVSMNTGPKATFGFDLAMTEIIEGKNHYFLVETGTELGAEIFREIPHKEASEKEKCAADDVLKKTAEQMGRSMDTANIKNLFYRNYEHPRWNNVAERCLTCANCTMVCPTCFCTTVEDVTDLTGEHAERWRKLDSCFTMDFSYIHGGSVRASTKSRYRHWITHKLATWIDQFGTSGCVGCGRCITWCPVAIDITEEVHAIRESETVIGKQKTVVKEDVHANT